MLFLQKGFSIIELLVVILILGMASSLVYINIKTIDSNSIFSDMSIDTYMQRRKMDSILSGQVMGIIYRNDELVACRMNTQCQPILSVPNFNLERKLVYGRTHDSQLIPLGPDDPIVFFYPNGTASLLEMSFEDGTIIKLIDE